jgi:endonuclease/exonuclease/phosphatase (EEP) superfamily protein YafD
VNSLIDYAIASRSRSLGWGNTIINDFPALRIDQIWASDALLVRNVVTHQTKNSDHRAVVTDFLWRSD